jgi:hypothetical protein
VGLALRRIGSRTGSPLVVVLLTVVMLDACGSTSSSFSSASGQAQRSQEVTARSGTITLSQARIPQPASPDVAVAYFTLTNDGDAADRLVAVSSSVSREAIPMRDMTHDGASTMVNAKRLIVPAHGETQLRPGATHLMLQGLTRTLRVGVNVVLRLRFAHNGTLVVRVPVTSMTTGSGEPTSDMTSMPGM